jgi:DNA-binding transcriptional regulator/RsmH inhibitor MraZ
MRIGMAVEVYDKDKMWRSVAVQLKAASASHETAEDIRRVLLEQVQRIRCDSARERAHFHACTCAAGFPGLR